ncbi:MAG: hypothetical protein HY607_03760 [Planctomycetes bacterium]|uniref:hypothetical protein n=1 Tax=Candidatus Wunengus californicus TaxID=3367619 RepID=UPI00402796AB|nr:hypothetical protein [Planctomycetota bacterium]
MFQPSDPLPPELLELRKFIDSCSEDIGLFQEVRHKEVFSASMKYTRKRYIQIFDHHNPYSDEHIAEQIFQDEVDQEQADAYMRCSWQAIEKCLDACSSRITSISTAAELDAALLQSEIKYLDDLFFDVSIFLSSVEIRKDKKRNGYGFRKRNIANSSEVFGASIDHLHHRLKFDTFSSFFRQPLAVFLIRQAIELRIKNAIGVEYVYKTSGEILKITPDFFIHFVYENTKIKCPVNKSIVKKIHAWSNYFIHAGFFMPSWQVWFAQRVLSPLFSDGQRPGSGWSCWSLYGAIEIEKSYYQGSLDDDIKAYICQRLPKLGLKPADLHIEKKHPEALLV